MPVTLYRSSDVGAPTLNGLAGTLIAVLDACLVNGYNLADVDVAKRRPAAGWTKPFSGANLAAYRQSPVAPSSGFYMRVDDAAANTAALGREARVRGYETMTAISTGLGLFPTAAQVTNGIIPRKSMTADATAREWVLIADDRTMHMFIRSGDLGNNWLAWSFGDYYSLRGSADPFGCMIAGRATEAALATPTLTAAQETLHAFSALTTNLAGHYCPRGWAENQVQTAAPVGKHGNSAHSVTTMAGIAMYPNGYDGSLLIYPIHVHESVTALSVIRGRVRGLWHIAHPPGSSRLGDGDTFTGTGAYAGKSFLILAPTADGLGFWCIETSSTWETNV